MPRPRTPKEIKQFLGLTGYYRKFIPRFSEIARPLTKLTAKDTSFEWTPQCQFSFEMLKNALMSAPILKYPDTEKPYTIFTDASKYGWAGVLTQEHTSVIDGKEVTTNHPVAYVSGMFRGSQLNWAAMTKEAYAIYMTVKKSTFYLTGAEITLRSDHLPLNKFLQKNTLNLHVNNWAVEIESFKIKFVHIAGKDNVIADTLSRLIDIDPDIVLEPELKDYEFGSYCFETLPKARSSSVTEKLTTVDGVDVCEIISHTTMTKIRQIPSRCLYLMKNFLSYRWEMRKLRTSEPESTMVNIQTSTKLKIIPYIEWSLRTTTGSMQLSSQQN